jgi:hypothetical protein
VKQQLISESAFDRIHALDQAGVSFHGDCEDPVDIMFASRQACFFQEVAVTLVRMHNEHIKQSRKNVNWYGCDHPDVLAASRDRLKDLKNFQLNHRHMGIVYMALRCRKCPSCRISHAKRWSKFAKIEAYEAASCWRSELTLNNGSYKPLEKRASNFLIGKYGNQYLEDPEVHRDEFEKTINGYAIPVIDEYIRRIKRRHSLDSYSYRYLIVTEFGNEDGRLHWHAMHFLQDPGKALGRRDVMDAWRHIQKHQHSRYKNIGFTRDKSVPVGAEKKAARHCEYVCKYVTKGPACRIRVSNSFGRRQLNPKLQIEGLVYPDYLTLNEPVEIPFDPEKRFWRDVDDTARDKFYEAFKSHPRD